MNCEKILQLLSEYSGTPVSDISLKTRLDSDLGINSLDFVTMICDIESEYNIYIEDSSFSETFSSTYTVGELMDIIEHYRSKNL